MFVIDSIRRNDNSNEALIIVDRERFRVTVHDLEALNIQEGDVVDDDVMEEIAQAAERLSCIKKAFEYLSYGDLSEKQLRDKLSKKFNFDLATDVASLLVERGYVNDARLAERYAETFYVFKNMGLKKIRNELYRRGISSDDIENALSKYENEDQSDRIEEFVRKKYDISRLDDVNYRRKVYAGAMRAGFSSSDVCDFLRNFESE